MKNIITKVHFYLLGIALVNFLIKSMSDISLNYRLTYIITLLIYICGLVLFIWYFRPFQKLAIYFSIYVIPPIIFLLFWLFGGVFLAILTSISLYPIYPYEIETESDEVVIYSKYQGFMGTCCPYEVTEKKFFLLEKKSLKYISMK